MSYRLLTELQTNPNAIEESYSLLLPNTARTRKWKKYLQTYKRWYQEMKDVGPQEHDSWISKEAMSTIDPTLLIMCTLAAEHNQEFHEHVKVLFVDPTENEKWDKFKVAQRYFEACFATQNLTSAQAAREFIQHLYMEYVRNHVMEAYPPKYNVLTRTMWEQEQQTTPYKHSIFIYKNKPFYKEGLRIKE
jgi:hypothetical protein